MNIDFNIGAMGDVALNRATASKRDSIASLASGRKHNQSSQDPGVFFITKITGAIRKQSGSESSTPKCNVHCTHSGGSPQSDE